ncbi:putative secreted protein (type I secretion substrate), partial [Sphaerotilus hippei]
NTVTEDATLASASGNVISAVGNSPAGGADVLGADAATVSGVVAGSAASASGNVGSALAGAYGSLTLNADGSYAYALDNANAAVNALKDGVSLSDTFTYTLTDADGSTSTTTLVITVAGHTDGVPTVVVPDTDGNANGGLNASDLTVSEAAGPTPGSFSISAPDGLASLSVGGTVLSPAQLSGLGTSPVSIATGEGTLVLTGYDAATGVVSYTYDPSAQTSPTTVIDAITLVVTDAGGASVSGSLDIAITDTGLSAVADANTVTEDATLASASGNVISAVGNSPAGGADVLGADAATVSGVIAGSAASASGNVGSALAGAYGSLTLNADGSYAYALDNANAAVNALNVGQVLKDVFTYRITDADGSTSTALLTLTINGANDAPSVVTINTAVSEEGLSTGLVDTLGSPTDTTNATLATGALGISDPDGTLQSVRLVAPSGADLASYKSGGVTLSWTLSADGTQLIGGVPDKVVVVVTIAQDSSTGAWKYTVNLQGSIDHSGTGEDVLLLPISLLATDDSGATSTSTLNISLEDDSPSALVPQVAQIAMTDTNLMIVLDVSGSMTETDGFNGQTRLETAIASIKSMLALYDGQGEVKVRLVTFSTSAAEASAAWLTVSEANAALDNLLALYNDPFTNAGYTNYHAALSTAMAAFTDSGALTTAQNVTYFISDGLPNIPDASGTSDITAAEQAAWTAMLDSYDMLSFAIGVGSDVATAQGQTALNPLAWDGTSGTDTNATIVSTFSQLSAALAATLPAPVNGNLISGTISSASTFGGDKGHMLSLTVDGITYTYAPAGAGAITVTGGTSAGVFDTVENVITITTTDGGVFKVDLDDGNYSYTSPSNLSAPITDVMSYVVIDKDGDTQSSSVTVVAGLPSSSTSSTSTAAAASFLGTSGADSYAGTGLADSAYGGDGNDILLGSSGNDLLHGGAGDDRLSGGTGNDQLTGGLGKDVFEWHLGDAGTSDTPAVDTITDFDPSPASSGGDILDLRDLLSGEGSGANNSVGNLDNYLDFGFSTSGTETSTTIHISSQGGFSSGVFSAAAEDQTIVLSGVDLRSSLSLTSSATDAQIIEALLQQGKLVVDPASGG